MLPEFCHLSYACIRVYVYACMYVLPTSTESLAALFLQPIESAEVISIPILPTFHYIPCMQQGIIGLGSCHETNF